MNSIGLLLLFGVVAVAVSVPVIELNPDVVFHNTTNGCVVHHTGAITVTQLPSNFWDFFSFSSRTETISRLESQVKFYAEEAQRERAQAHTESQRNHAESQRERAQAREESLDQAKRFAAAIVYLNEKHENETQSFKKEIQSLSAQNAELIKLVEKLTIANENSFSGLNKFLETIRADVIIATNLVRAGISTGSYSWIAVSILEVVICSLFMAFVVNRSDLLKVLGYWAAICISSIGAYWVADFGNANLRWGLQLSTFCVAKILLMIVYRDCRIPTPIKTVVVQQQTDPRKVVSLDNKNDDNHFDVPLLYATSAGSSPVPAPVKPVKPVVPKVIVDRPVYWSTSVDACPAPEDGQLSSLEKRRARYERNTGKKAPF